MTDHDRPIVPRVTAAPIETRAAASIRGVLDELREPAYLQLLGKSVGTGLAVGLVARRIPAIGLPVALLGGIYVGLELAAYIAEQGRHEIGPWIDAEALQEGSPDDDD